MDLGARWAAVHGVAKSRTRLNNFTFTACIFFFFLMLKLKPQYFGHLMRRVNFGKGPNAGKD